MTCDYFQEKMTVKEEEEMNQLNSVLIEGTLMMNPRVIATDKKNEGWGIRVMFKVANLKWRKDDRNMVREEVMVIPCEATGNLAEVVKDKIKEGMTVRVVGRLSGNEGKFKIIVHHVEYRREKGKIEVADEA